MSPQIIGLRGEQARRQFALGDAPLTFGRNPENTVVLAGGRASRHHAEIRHDGADFVLADLGSANGTFVNGQRLSAPHRLRDGDTIDIGDDSFRFEAPAPATDKTLVVAPHTPSAPPTAPAAPPLYSAPPNAYAGGVPNVPARPAGSRRTLLVVLGMAALVLTIACIGGAVVLSRATPALLSSPTSASARTPQPSAAASEPTVQSEPTPAAAASDPAPTRAPVAGAADWTVLVYLDGDNNLERDAINDFNEMERAGSNDRVKIVAQFDRIHLDGPEDDSSNGDWDSTKRFLIQQDDDPRAIASQELDDLGEQNMGSPQTLADFITWGVKAYPAQHYALILWDHGSSWAGVAFDDSDGEKGLSLPELEVALRTAESQSGSGPLDLIGFDACLMSQIDVLQTIAPYGRVAVASAELEPNDGWAWDTWLKQLNQNPSEDAAAVGKAIVASYQDYYKDSAHDTVTLAAFDLSKLAAVQAGFSALSDAMLKDLGQSYQAIATARSSADAYSQPKPEEFSAVDLGDFTRLIGRQDAPPELTSLAEALATQIKQARIAEWHGSFHDRSTGMSVFFPQVSELYPASYEQASPLPRSTSWARFLKEFYSTGGQQVSAPVISDLQLSSPVVGISNPATLEGTVTGKNIAQIFSFIGVPNSDRSGVELTDIDYIYPPGSSPNAEVPDWEDGSYKLRSTWDGTRWALSNGTDTIPVLLGPTKYGTSLYGVEGIYTFGGSGEQIGAGLLFEVDQGNAQLQQIYGFPKSQKQETQPFEIKPSAGDTFTALLRTYTIKDGRPTPDFNRGQTITLTDTPLSAMRTPAANGDYVTGFLVRDISGHFNYQYVDIQVDNTGATPPQIQPTAGAGAQSGTLAFNSPEGQFGLAYPAGWKTLDTGKSMIYFYDPAEASRSFVSVEYLTTKQSPEQATQAVLETYSDILAKEQGFQRGDAGPFKIAGEQGQAFKYSYTNKDGEELTGVAIAVTSPRTHLSYVVTVQARSSDFDAQSDIFNAILDSFQIA